MKLLRFNSYLLAFAALGLPLSAQTNTFPSSGDVGIGTVSPGVGKLEIVKSSSYNSENTAGIAINTGASGQPEILFGADNGNSIAYIQSLSKGTSIGPLAVNATGGNVGIGTTNPHVSLHVVTTAANDGNPQLLLSRNSGDYGLQVTAYSNILFKTKLSDNATWQSFMQIGEGLTSANAHLILQPVAGNVGIGTTTPQSRLSVVNTSGVTLQLDKPTGASIQFSRSGTDGYQIDDNLGAMRWLSSGGTERMRIDASGNLGIGTTNPTQKLSVNGTIQAKEVVVQTGWSDYVFRPDYPLASLSEVEGAIKRDGHLPGIPSAQEVAEHGVSMGDMQSKLLAKIEELTLHQIEQEKRLIVQQNQLAAQQEEIRALKKTRQ